MYPSRMTPEQWAEKYNAENGGAGAYTYLMRESGLSLNTVKEICKTGQAKRPATAFAFAAATGNEVSAASLLGLETPLDAA